MEEPCRKTYVLFLANVFPDQCQDESEVLRSITEPEILNSSESESTSDEDEIPNFFSEISNTEEYEALPDYFTGVDSWPKTTNLLCWSCTNKFSNMPWFIPISMVKKVYSENTDDPDEIPDNLVDFPDMARTKEIKAFKRRGCFCNPFCARRYINRVKDPEIPNKWEANKLLNILYKEITGKDVHNIPEGEDKTIMMQFCGPKGITAQEFRYRNETRNIIL